jgi:hypothetical protein
LPEHVTPGLAWTRVELERGKRLIKRLPFGRGRSAGCKKIGFLELREASKEARAFGR